MGPGYGTNVFISLVPRLSSLQVTKIGQRAGDEVINSISGVHPVGGGTSPYPRAPSRYN